MPAIERPTGEAVYSIGAVASMVGVPPATLRTWEERYGLIHPTRTETGRRLYSRDQVEDLRFIASEIARGISAADAHRLAAGRVDRAATTPTATAATPRLLILLAARSQYSAELVEFFLRTEGFRVEFTLDADEAKRIYGQAQPNLSIVEFLITGGSGEDLCRWLAEQGGGPVLVLSSLDVPDRALAAGAAAFLVKPVGHLQLVAVVKDLLGISALVSQGDGGSR